MAHGGDDGRLAVVDGPGDPLVVEGPQVLHGPAAPAGDDDVADPPLVRVPDGAGDLRRGLRSLHPHGQQDHLGQGIAAAEYADHVVDRRPGTGGDDGDLLRVRGQGHLVGGVEEPLLPELLLELLEGHRQIPRPLGSQGIAVELVGPVPGKDRDPAGGHCLHAVLRPEPEAGGLSAEHDAPEGSLAVLQGEVVVAGGIDLVVGQLPPHQDALEDRRVVQQALHQLVHLGDCKDMGLHGRRLPSVISGTENREPDEGGGPPSSRSRDCPYSAVSWRTKLPRMPLMNFTVSGVSYFLAISTASLMDAPLGMSGM